MSNNFTDKDLRKQMPMEPLEQSNLANIITPGLKPLWNSHSDTYNNPSLYVGSVGSPIYNALQIANNVDPEINIDYYSLTPSQSTRTSPSISSISISIPSTSNSLDLHDQSRPSSIDNTHPVRSITNRTDNTHSNESQAKVKYIDLNKLLSSTCDGKLIKKAYTDNDNFLPENARTELTRLIIKWETDRRLETLYGSDKRQITEFKIDTEVFIEYAEQIVQLFPGECRETYFSKFVKVNGQRILAHGKLWDRFNTVKCNLRKKGLLAAPLSRRTLLELEKNIVIITEDEQSLLTWLENHCEPWTQVCDYWERTLKIRQRLLMRDKLEAYQYFNQFAGLKLQRGLDLINIDFHTLYPAKSENLPVRWNIIKPHLIRKIKQSKKIKDVNDLAFVHLLKTLPSETQDGLIFYLLPYIIDQQRKVTSKGARKDDEVENLDEPPSKKIRRLPLEERRTSFTLRIENSVDLDALLDERRKTLRKSKQTLQPTPVITGSLVKPETFCVLYDNFKYKVTSYLHAIDITFKIFFITQCAYPENSGVLWLFVQRARFCIQQPTDKYSPSLSSLVGEVEKIVSQNACT